MVLAAGFNTHVSGGHNNSVFEGGFMDSQEFDVR